MDRPLDQQTSKQTNTTSRSGDGLNNLPTDGKPKRKLICSNITVRRFNNDYLYSIYVNLSMQNLHCKYYIKFSTSTLLNSTWNFRQKIVFKTPDRRFSTLGSVSLRAFVCVCAGLTCVFCVRLCVYDMWTLNNAFRGSIT